MGIPLLRERRVKDAHFQLEGAFTGAVFSQWNTAHIRTPVLSRYVTLDLPGFTGLREDRYSVVLEFFAVAVVLPGSTGLRVLLAGMSQSELARVAAALPGSTRLQSLCISIVAPASPLDRGLQVAELVAWETRVG